MTIKITGREKRHLRLRKRIVGTAQRPRLNVRRSLKNLFIQIIDDSKKATILSVSTTDKSIRSKITYGGNIKAAVLLGDAVASMAKAKNITKVVFDRGGYDYHGRIKAFAEAARKGGLEF